MPSKDKRCGCNKPKPKTSKSETVTSKDKRCGCQNNAFSKQPAAKRPNKRDARRATYPEKYYTKEDAQKLAAIQYQRSIAEESKA